MSLGIVGLVAVIVATYISAARYLDKQTPTTAKPCGSPETVRFVVIEHNKVTPDHTDANRCDILRIVNKDDMLRLMAFGQHDHHVEYDGISEKPLTQDKSLIVTLNRTGEFRFHDHLHDEVTGTFSVHD
jgi:hypothetical protein